LSLVNDVVKVSGDERVWTAVSTRQPELETGTQQRRTVSLTVHTHVVRIANISARCGPLRGVAMPWTGVDMSTPLLSEVVPEIDADSVSFYSGGGVSGFREFAKYGEFSKFGASVGHQKLKGFQLQGDLPLTP